MNKKQILFILSLFLIPLIFIIGWINPIFLLWIAGGLFGIVLFSVMISYYKSLEGS